MSIFSRPQAFPPRQATDFMPLDASLKWDFCCYFVQHHLSRRSR